MNHMAKLESEHSDLDQQIRDELKAPSCNDIRVAHLKRLKLAKKDEISAYAAQQRERSEPALARA